jgi:hypothetical protein
METDNIFTEIVKEMQDEMAGLRERNKPATPFMQEKLSPSQFRSKLDAMPPGERKEWSSDMKREDILSLVRGK